MRVGGRRYVAAAIVLLVAVVAAVASPQLRRARMYMTGSVIPDGSRTLVSSEHNRVWLSGVGRRWVTRDRQEEAAAYYALVVPPRGRVRADGSASANDGFSQTDTLKWVAERDLGGGALEQAGGSLTVRYDAVGRDVTIGPDTYSLSKGNVFVIRLDEGWRPHVTQVAASFSRDDGFEAAHEAVRLALPHDEEIKGL